MWRLKKRSRLCLDPTDIQVCLAPAHFTKAHWDFFGYKFFTSCSSLDVSRPPYRSTTTPPVGHDPNVEKHCPRTLDNLNSWNLKNTLEKWKEIHIRTTLRLEFSRNMVVVLAVPTLYFHEFSWSKNFFIISKAILRTLINFEWFFMVGIMQKKLLKKVFFSRIGGILRNENFIFEESFFLISKVRVILCSWELLYWHYTEKIISIDCLSSKSGL